MAVGQNEPPRPGELDPATQFPVLYQREYANVYRTVRAIVLDPHEAEDVAQESFAKAYRARLRYRPTAPPGAWLHRIAVNTAISHLRRRRLARLLPARLYQAPDDRDYAQSEARGVLEAALAQLSPQLRATVVLHYFHDYSRDEIAKILGIPSGTVASRMAKAMSIMRRWMAEQEQSAGPVRSESS
ncbi:MAG: RNA polymerase sigma factor [Candidatus Dormibacteraeota bacterium]|nr:RNA polymerase sigma factor [Candidatus Dormibacteraeota bacterium]